MVAASIALVLLLAAVFSRKRRKPRPLDADDIRRLQRFAERICREQNSQFE